MALLRNLEHSLSGLVEGTVGRVFRTEVRPTEIARKLAREMEINKRVSLSRTYAPTDYLVYLSPQDRARYTGVEESIADELGAYLLEHARRERLVLVRRPLVVFRTDQRLRLGEFGIEARTAPISAEEAPPRPERSLQPEPDMAPRQVPRPAAPEPEPEPAPRPAPRQPEPEPEFEPLQAAAPEPDEHGFDDDDYLALDADQDHEHVDDAALGGEDHGPDWLEPIDDWAADGPSPAAVPWIDPALTPRADSASRPKYPDAGPLNAPSAPAPVPPAPQLPPLTLLVDGTPHQIVTDGAVIGRSRSCEIAVPDPSISRRHVELRCDEHGWYVTDLGSTNGSTLDGAPLTAPQRLAPGQRLGLGHAAVVIEVQ